MMACDSKVGLRTKALYGAQKRKDMCHFALERIYNLHFIWLVLSILDSSVSLSLFTNLFVQLTIISLS